MFSAFAYTLFIVMEPERNQIPPFNTRMICCLTASVLRLLGSLVIVRISNQKITENGVVYLFCSPGNQSICCGSSNTRVEAYDAITATLEQQGLKVGTAEFDAGMQQAWKDNNIAALPEK
jgi:hypothetical protein